MIVYGGSFKKRYDRIVSCLSQYQTSVINRWLIPRKEQVATYRFLSNEKVSMETLINPLTTIAPELVLGQSLLVLMDSSELNYHSHRGRFAKNDPDLGVLSNNKSVGFHIHPALVVQADSHIPVGIAGLRIWSRPKKKRKKTPTDESRTRRKPIEEKESYKWLEVGQSAKDQLASASHLTFISDRESDIYEFLSRMPDEKSDVIVRFFRQRKLANGLLLSEHLDQLAWQGSTQVEVGFRKKPKRTARTAHLQVRWTSVELAKSKERKTQDPSQIEVQAVEFLESPDSVPEGEKPIHWRLFTSCSVTCLEEALEIGRRYSQRWWIEDLFRSLKTKGLEIEESQLSTGIALQKMTILALGEALRILMMRQARHKGDEWKAELCFSDEQIACLEDLKTRVEGDTKKQKNPYTPRSLAWAVWIIARCGGWDPYGRKKRPPGVTTLVRGMERFQNIYMGWILVKATKDDPLKPK